MLLSFYPYMALTFASLKSRGLYLLRFSDLKLSNISTQDGISVCSRKCEFVYLYGDDAVAQGRRRIDLGTGIDGVQRMSRRLSVGIAILSQLFVSQSDWTENRKGRQRLGLKSQDRPGLSRPDADHSQKDGSAKEFQMPVSNGCDWCMRRQQAGGIDK